MTLCTDCEIVYDTRNCPLCEAKERIEGAENKIDELTDEIKSHECEVSQ